MTRKRFIKLLMSRGYSRNETINRADLSLTIWSSYSELWKWMQLEIALRPITNAFIRLGRGAKRVEQRLRRLNERYGVLLRTNSSNG